MNGIFFSNSVLKFQHGGSYFGINGRAFQFILEVISEDKVTIQYGLTLAMFKLH